MTTKRFCTERWQVKQLEMGNYDPKNSEMRLGLNIPTVEKMLWGGDSNGCTLVIPEGFEAPKRGGHCQRGLPEFLRRVGSK